jgi:hypothetical protein
LPERPEENNKGLEKVTKLLSDFKAELKALFKKRT